GILVA
ncbi:hypothetical protein BVZ79_01140B, partial [Haemophilus influenzae]